MHRVGVGVVVDFNFDDDDGVDSVLDPTAGHRNREKCLDLSSIHKVMQSFLERQDSFVK